MHFHAEVLVSSSIFCIPLSSMKTFIGLTVFVLSSVSSLGNNNIVKFIISLIIKPHNTIVIYVVDSIEITPVKPHN